jgi:hypothetical protein
MKSAQNAELLGDLICQINELCNNKNWFVLLAMGGGRTARGTVEIRTRTRRLARGNERDDGIPLKCRVDDDVGGLVPSTSASRYLRDLRPNKRREIGMASVSCPAMMAHCRITCPRCDEEKEGSIGAQWGSIF